MRTPMFILRPSTYYVTTHRAGVPQTQAITERDLIPS